MNNSIFKILILVVVATGSGALNYKSEKFSIIAFGDMPYVLPEDYGRFENLITAVNNQQQAFNVHVGDIKSSSTKCTEEYYEKIYHYFEQFNKPLIYTPGDNEWTDCNKPEAGGYEPEERLSVIRKMFFKTNSSFGKQKIILIAQSENPQYSKYVENRRWAFGEITFGTVHLVGTNNNFLPESKNQDKEFFERDNANAAWLVEIFKVAKLNNSPGIFLFTQADMFTLNKAASGCFVRFLRELKRLTIDFGKPVILVNGDSHKFIVDKPLLIDETSKKVIQNFTRIQVFGESDIHAVKIMIDPASPSLFSTEQLLVEGN